MTSTRLTYVFDAYCGWCYGFAPALHELAQDDGITIEVIGGGLFSDHHAGRIGALKEASGGRDLDMAAAMQQAFYLDGLSLSDAGTYRTIATREGLDSDWRAGENRQPGLLGPATAQGSQGPTGSTMQLRPRPLAERAKAVVLRGQAPSDARPSDRLPTTGSCQNRHEKNSFAPLYEVRWRTVPMIPTM